MILNISKCDKFYKWIYVLRVSYTNGIHPSEENIPS